MIRVQQADFVVADEYHNLQQSGIAGAIVTFSGLVRDFAGDAGESFFLQHYPGMTESVLNKIVSQAESRWPLLAVTVIHRVGHLQAGDQIVFVGVSSAHRKTAFAACEYIIDVLKTEAPFWKKEGSQWVAAKQSDQAAADRWLTADDS